VTLLRPAIYCNDPLPSNTRVSSVFSFYKKHHLKVTPFSLLPLKFWAERVQCETKASLSCLLHDDEEEDGLSLSDPDYLKSGLEDPPEDPERFREISVSLVTPPSRTLVVLQEAWRRGVRSVWLQPGTWNEESLKFAHDNFETVLAGPSDMGRRSWCVLCDGKRGLRAAGRL
jgi:hypothetical protein